ncbi:MAG: hypothetical protein CMO55_07960 [Verrucomicrobiales bacterium]|nr:hypothetical protein [Verrucomicrobiales bacterium]
MSEATDGWKKAEAEYFSFGWGWGSHSSLGRCTRHVAYQPGRDRFSGLIEKQRGRFTFEAHLLARLISDVRGANLSVWGSDQGLLRWLSRSDRGDERTTKFPGNCFSIDPWIERLLPLHLCQTYCEVCNAMISPSALLPGIRAEARFHSFSEIRCPAGHLLIRPHIVHVYRTRGWTPPARTRALSWEEEYFRRKPVSVSPLGQLMGMKDGKERHSDE